MPCPEREDARMTDDRDCPACDSSASGEWVAVLPFTQLSTLVQASRIRGRGALLLTLRSLGIKLSVFCPAPAATPEDQLEPGGYWREVHG